MLLSCHQLQESNQRKAVQGGEGLRARQTSLVELTPTSSPPRNTPSPLFVNEKDKEYFRGEAPIYIILIFIIYSQ